jgi:hypothetical protein
MPTKKFSKVGMPSKASRRTTTAEPKKMGRPRGKHTDPNYKQMSVYVRKDVRLKVKTRLLESGGEFSALVESLLEDWLDNGKGAYAGN